MSYDFFPDHELASPDTHTHAMIETFMERLIAVRRELDRPMVLSSAYRTPEYNEEIKGHVNSAHLLGRAVDVAISGEDAFNLVRIALEHGFTGIGIRQHGKWPKRFVHLDDTDGDKRPRIWTYDKAPS